MARVAQSKRELFKAAEVCDVVQLQPYVLRSWEAEFPQLGQVPAGGGPRVYRKADIELVLRIKQLILDEGLTLSGARRRLEQDDDKGNGAALAMVEDVVGNRVRERLKNVRNGLESILAMLSKNGDEQPELRLVAHTAAKKKTVAKAKAKK